MAPAIRAMRWCFTYHVPEHQQREIAFGELKESLEEHVGNNVKFGFFGREQCPTTQRWHAQGFVVMTRAMTFNHVKALSFAGIHWEKANGNPQQNWDYCTKEDKTPMVIGEMPEFLSEGARAKADYKRVIELAKAGDWDQLEEQHAGVYLRHYKTMKLIHQEAICKTQPARLEACNAEWIWGMPGSGKSMLSYDENPEYYDKMPNKWWDNYMGQDVIVIQDLDPTRIERDCLVDEIKRWCDIYPFPAEVKGGSLGCIRPKKIVITSNFSIEQCFPKGQDAIAVKRRVKERFMKDFKEYTEPGGMMIKDHTKGEPETPQPIFVSQQSTQTTIDLYLSESTEEELIDELHLHAVNEFVNDE